MNQLRNILLICLSGLLLGAKAQASKIKMQKTPSGLEYKIFKSNKGPRIAGGDLVFFKLKGIVSDSTLYDTYLNKHTPYMSFALQEKCAVNNFEEGLTLLTKGDSALFLVVPDSFFKVYVGSAAPAFIKKGDKINFYVKVDSFITKTALAALKVKEDAEAKLQKENELSSVEAYVKSSGLKFTKTTSGMYYIITETTQGERAKQGDMISANYTGKLFNGKIFDSNKTRGNPFEFELGAHRVIAGWDEIFSILKVGEKATIVLPSALAYGERGAGADIKPFTPLVFDVEFLGIVPAQKEPEPTLAPTDAAPAHDPAKETNDIQSYITKSGVKFNQTSTGLLYIITKESQGPKAKPGDKVGAIYTGKFLEGKVFDSNKASNTPFEFTLGAHQVIAGWDEIFGILKEGENATIILPSSLAYGPNGAGGVIPPYTPLLFEVEFSKLIPAQK